MSERTGAPMTSEQTRTPAQQVEKTVVCTKCGHPVWFMAEEREATTCTDCGTVNLRAQPDISETDDEEFATAALVAALAEMVAELRGMLSIDLAGFRNRIDELDMEFTRRHNDYLDRFKALSDRLAALESPAAAPEPLCQNCGHGEKSHYGKTGKCHFVHSKFWETGGSVSGCGCLKFVPAEPPAAALDAAPTDKVLDKIVDLYLIMFPVRNEAPSSQIEMGLRDEFGRRTGIGPGWETVDAAIRAYGRDGDR